MRYGDTVKDAVPDLEDESPQCLKQLTEFQIDFCKTATTAATGRSGTSSEAHLPRSGRLVRLIVIVRWAGFR